MDRLVNDRVLKASRGALELWLDATKWWAGAVVETAGVVRDENVRLLAETAQEVARRWEGRRVEAVCAGRPLHAVVDAIQIYRGVRDAARLKLRDVSWDGLRIEWVSVFADEVSIKPPPGAALALSGVQLEGRVELSEVVARCNQALPGWQLAVATGNLVEALAPDGRVSLTVDPRVANGRLDAELREVRWRRLRLPFPRWLRLVRTFDLPVLPESISVREARRCGDAVEFVLTLPDVSRPLDLRGVISRSGGV